MKFEIKTDEDSFFGTYRFTRVYAILPSGSRIQVYSETKCGEDGELSEEWAREQIALFEKTDRKCFQAYCRGECVTHDVLSFLKWIEENGYHFRRDEDSYCAYIYERGDFCYEFHGNLEEVSSAFSFYIFDGHLLDEVRKFVEKNKRDARKKRKERV